MSVDAKLIETGDKRLKLVALQGSYAATRAKQLARVGQRAQVELDRFLGPDSADIVKILLSDPVDDRAFLGQHVLTVRPESSDTDLIELLVDDRLERAAPAAAHSPILRDGLAGVVAARAVTAIDLDELKDVLRERIEEGQDVTIFSPEVPSAVATSFVGFLSDEFGVTVFGNFLKEYDPDRPDQSAQNTFHRPIGTLEELWLQEVTRRRGASPLRAFLRQIFPLLRPHWKEQLELGIYRLFGLGYGLLIPLSGKYLLDNIIPGRDGYRLTIFVVILAALYIVNAMVEMRGAYLQTWLNLKVLTGLQESMFAHLQQLPHSFYARAKVGDIMTRLTGDMTVVQQAITALASGGIMMALTAGSAAVALFVLNPILAALVMVVVPAFMITYLVLQKHFRQASYERQRFAGETTNLVQENLSAQTVIKAYGMQDRAVRLFSARMVALDRSTIKLARIGTIFQTSMNLASTLGQLLVFGIGGYLVMKGSLTVGTLLAFIALIPNLFHPLAALSGVGQQIETASGSMQRINELIHEPVQIGDVPDAVDLPPLAKRIQFEDVSFGYGGQRQILRNLNIDVPVGTHVAIVGPSGAGKSTIVNLLMRFWDPDTGRVTVDGHDLRDVKLQSLRAQTGLVFQETFIFDTTLRENIAIGRPDATDEQIVAAAKAAALDEFIATLPAGYDSVLGERGVRMSGGQRQRLAIARALLRDPQILILDEATSALDVQTEQEIVETLIDLARGRTTITITHRLGLAARADRIIAISNGAVVEEGSHDELLMRNGLYRQLYDEQMGIATKRPPVVQIARLKEVPLFERLEPVVLGLIAERLMPEKFAAGDDIVHQGDRADKFYVISSGRAEVMIDEGLGPRAVNVLREGDFFGELALLSGEQRTASVRASDPTELYSLSHEDFLALMEMERSVRAGVEAVMAERRANVAEAS